MPTYEEALEDLYWAVLGEDEDQLQRAIRKAEEALGFNFRTIPDEYLS